MKQRFTDEKLRPAPNELKFIEVLKKIIESGWIIKEEDIK